LEFVDIPTTDAGILQFTFVETEVEEFLGKTFEVGVERAKAQSVQP
jgi:hypothetical protein